MTEKQLAEYAEQERVKVTEFFNLYKGELPKVKIGCEDITNPQLMVSTALERIKQSHKSQDFIANMIRIKRYKKYLENG